MTTKKLLRISLLVAWLCLTVFLSLQVGDSSSRLSNWIALRIVNFFGLSVRVDVFHTVLREAAHFVMHLVLAGLMFRALILFTETKKVLIACLLICFVIALFDEVIQGQVSGRTCEMLDLVLNLLGVETGLLVGVLMSSET